MRSAAAVAPSLVGALLLVSCRARPADPSPGRHRAPPPAAGSPPASAPPSSPSASGAPPDPPASAIDLPGRCEPIPQVSWVAFVSMRQASPHDAEHGPRESGPVRRAMRTHPTMDVDGDGTPDVLVPNPGARDCPHVAPFDLYVVRGACGHRVGTLIGDLEAAAPRPAGSAGLPDLTTSTTYGEQGHPREPAVKRTDRRTYRFEGVAYREVDRTSETGVCHHCSIATCVVQRD